MSLFVIWLQPNGGLILLDGFVGLFCFGEQFSKREYTAGVVILIDKGFFPVHVYGAQQLLLLSASNPASRRAFHILSCPLP